MLCSPMNAESAIENDMDKIKRVMWGRFEHPATIFVPWDCGHHCPFCTTKAEYESKYPASRLDYYFERLKNSVRHLLEYEFVDDVVITGGEPLADVSRLRELIEVIRRDERSHRNVYINTSLNLPDDRSDKAIRFLCSATERLVDGISVSLPYADVSMTNARGYALLGRFMKECPREWRYDWIRVNSVVRGNESPEQLRRFVKDIRALENGHLPGIWSINLRKDYTSCTQANLNDCQDPTFRTLMSMADMPYKGGGGCLVCRNDVFWPDNDGMHRLIYHRGTESTSLRYGDMMVINDIVIKQDGEIRYDWKDGAVLPKCVMDALCEVEDPDEPEWKWKNPLFSHRLVAQTGLGEMTCRDHETAERCS